jgi:hypothetical protein
LSGRARRRTLAQRPAASGQRDDQPGKASKAHSGDGAAPSSTRKGGGADRLLY